MSSQYYWTCPYCGSNLDPGETCDCKNVENDKSLIACSDHPPNGTADNYKVVTGGVNENV